MIEREAGRPLVVAIAGPNGAGKSTLYETQLKPLGLRFVNADNIARQLDLEAYAAAGAADVARRELFLQRASFVFETVFSDPVGDKVAFLKEMEAAGYRVILCFIGFRGRMCRSSGFRCGFRRAGTMFRRARFASGMGGRLRTLRWR